MEMRTDQAARGPSLGIKYRSGTESEGCGPFQPAASQYNFLSLGLFTVIYCNHIHTELLVNVRKGLNSGMMLQAPQYTEHCVTLDVVHKLCPSAMAMLNSLINLFLTIT